MGRNSPPGEERPPRAASLRPAAIPERPGRLGTPDAFTRSVSASSLSDPPNSPPTGSGALHFALEEVAHRLPAQGPIATFIHHNTLHAFQHLSFHDAVAEACAIFDAEGYLPESEYRAAWQAGRISDDDVAYALARRRRELPDRRIGALRLSQIEGWMLREGVVDDPPVALRWAREELDRARRFRHGVSAEAERRILTRSEGFLARAESAPTSSLAAALRLRARGEDVGAALEASWAVCAELAEGAREKPSERLLARIGIDRTHRDLLVAAGAPDPAAQSNAELVSFLAAYLDEGMARWSMPNRERGLLRSFVAQLEAAPLTEQAWLRSAHQSLAASLSSAASPAQMLETLLEDLGVAQPHWGSYLLRAHAALPGWAGMVARLEHHPEDRRPGAPPASLLELSILRLTLDRSAVQERMALMGLEGRPRKLVDEVRRAGLLAHLDRADATIDRLHQITQLAGHAAPDLVAMGAETVHALVDAIEDFDGLSRRRVLHEAYERHHLLEIVGAVDARLAEPQPAPRAPRLQTLFCIDDREEAFRRHLEEQDPAYETFGAAGFFGVAMRYTSLDDPSSRDLCPIAVKAGHAIHEQPASGMEARAEERRRRRALLALVAHELTDGSRSFFRGVLVTSLLGLFALLPLALQLASPRLATRALRWLASALVPGVDTELGLERADEAHEASGLPLGFTLEEQVDRVEALLRNIGLVSGFAPLVTLLGHGASTVNNPHHSAYECGACGGSNGGPNARAFAHMANDPRVRAALSKRGIEIDRGTWFLGGLHDTTNDAVTLYDRERVPASHHERLAELERALDRAREGSAHERCRRFEHADLRADPSHALRHVETRAVDLSQARPELGHATNAVAVVGRRALTRGLFLDRRAFLISYDPTHDDELVLLGRILRAVMPVGAGINLEYYFSRVDPQRFGAGTKLPHNVAALLGVMEGTSGDLRTGLPTQMVEIHEPVRLLCLVEASPEALLAVAAREPEVAELALGGWVRLVSVDPETRHFLELVDGAFVPVELGRAPIAERARSVDWYGGKREPLGPALLGTRQEEAA